MTEPIPVAVPDLDGHLRIDGLSRQLKHRSARGGALMIISYAIQLLIGIGGTAVLARLLNPIDFGYMAMVGTLINFVMMFREFLINPAVQQEQLTHQQASGLFWINCLTSLVVAAAVAAMAPVLALFFHQPRLLAITLVMAGGVLLSMLGMLHLGLLRRQMNFAAITILEIGAITAGVAVGVTSALLHAGYWALVYQQLAIWAWQSAAAFWLCGWRPARTSQSAFGGDASVRGMLRYGRDSTASRLVTYISRNTDAVLIGYFAGPSILGLYQKAYQWAMTPFWQLSIPLAPVAVAAFSRLQNDPDRYRIYVRTIFLALFGLTLPAMALLMIEADGVILFLMGSKWIDAIPMLRMLSIGAYFSSFTLVTTLLYLPEGRTTEQLRWSLASAPVMMLAVASGMRWGANGVAIGFAVASVLLVVPGVWYCLRRSPVTATDFAGSVWRAAAASIVAAALLWLLRQFIPSIEHPFVRVLVHCAIYSALYITLWLALPGGRSNASELVRHLRELRRGVPLD